MIIKIRDQTCHLLAERALYWEEEKAVVIADIHIGKATVFRRSGVPIPEGNMEEDLTKLTLLLKKIKPKKCLIVGDLIHAKSGLSASVINQFSEWLEQLDCEVHLIVGNHDRALIKSLPNEWPLVMHKEGLLMGTFYFSHYPVLHENAFVWSGHLHPKFLLKNRHDQLTLRCFHVTDKMGILPAFGSFVGGTYVKRDKGSEVYVIADDLVIKV